MSDCKVVYKDNKGFWTEEVFMQLMYHYIYEEFVKPQYIVTDKNKLLYEMRFHIDGYSVDSMSLGWGGFVESKAEIQTMTDMLEQVKITLNSKGEYIDRDELQSIYSEDVEFKMYISYPFPTEGLIKIADALIEMLNDRWPHINHYLKVDY